MLLRADSMIGERQGKKIKYDTLYLKKPDARWTFKLRTNLSGSSITGGNMSHLDKTRGMVHTRLRATISMAAFYRGIGVALALNPGKLAGKSNDYEFNMNSYSNRYGFDIVYSRAKTYSGHIVLDGQKHDVRRGEVSLRMFNFNAYYAFNYRRFSYPAAFSQSYWQLKSAGSWLVGVSFMGGRVLTTDIDIADYNHIRAYLGNFSIGGGYGYNLVTRHRWLFHLSAMPTIVVINRNNLQVNGGEKTYAPFHFPDMILTERMAVVHDFNRQWFASATLVMNNTLFGKPDKLFYGFNKWRLRVGVGLRL